MTEQAATVRILTHIVAPAGSAVWAFTQASGTSSAATAWLLIAIVVAGLFLGFRNTVAMADDRLNRGGAA